jgi:hypothetical protein
MTSRLNHTHRREALSHHRHTGKGKGGNNEQLRMHRYRHIYMN